MNYSNSKCLLNIDKQHRGGAVSTFVNDQWIVQPHCEFCMTGTMPCLNTVGKLTSFK